MVSHPVHHSFREYISHEAASNVKHEYLGGHIYARAGGSPEHSALIATLAAQLAEHVRGGPCRVHMSDLRIQVQATELTTYPDITVVCGPWLRHPQDPNTITNPAMIVEVLSPSTADYDRGEKLDHYKRIPSLEVCLLVSVFERKSEVWRRTPDRGWKMTVAQAGSVELPVIGGRVDLDAAYRDAAEPTEGQ